jgi:hypothetical protein
MPNLQRFVLISERSEAGWRPASTLVDQRGDAPDG